MSNRLENIHNDPSLFAGGEAPAPTDFEAERERRSNTEPDLADVRGVGPSTEGPGAQGQRAESSLGDLKLADLRKLAEEHNVDHTGLDTESLRAELTTAGIAPGVTPNATGEQTGQAPTPATGGGGYPEGDPDDTWKLAELQAYAAANGVAGDDLAAVSKPGTSKKNVLAAIEAAKA